MPRRESTNISSRTHVSYLLNGIIIYFYSYFLRKIYDLDSR